MDAVEMNPRFFIEPVVSARALLTIRGHLAMTRDVLTVITQRQRDWLAILHCVEQSPSFRKFPSFKYQ